MLIARIGALAQPGQPNLQAPPGGVIAKFRRQANDVMLKVSRLLPTLRRKR